MMDNGAEPRPPAHPELELALVGAVLAENAIFERVASVVSADDFTDPLLVVVWDEIAATIRAGRAALPRTIGQALSDYDQEEQPVTEYLIALVGAAIGLEAENHARLVRNAADQRRLMNLGEALRTEAAQGGAQPATELAARYASDLHGIGHGLAEWEDFGEVGKRALEGLENPRPAYATGIQCIDHRLLGGFQAGRFYGVAARHKAGKSMLMGTIAYNIATSENRCGVVYLTLEMSPEEMWRRIVSRHIGVNDARLASARERGEPELIEKARVANEDLRNRGLYFLGRPGCTLDELRTIVARAGMSDKIAGVIVDYLQLLSGRPRGQSTAEFLDEAAQALANATRRYGLWIAAAAQLNQEGNVRGSEGLLNACDLALFLHKVERNENVNAWLEIRASRYTPAKDIGSKESPPLVMDFTAGPHFRAMGLL